MLWPALVIAAALVVSAILLHLEGRLWICSCGRLQVWAGKVCSSDNSQHFLDPYSFTHILHGFLFFWLIAWLAPRLKSHWPSLLRHFGKFLKIRTSLSIAIARRPRPWVITVTPSLIRSATYFVA